ncbi:MAG: Type 1 glutamine amidotransferase-like domain-containing protein [Friedmanniella sp.]|jgi:cyanophycinase
MSIHLVGGGRDETRLGAVYGGFANEAADHARARGAGEPRVAVVTVHEPDDVTQGAEKQAWFAAAVRATARVSCLPVALPEGAALEAGSLRGLDGMLVAGGLTPAYATALGPVAQEIRGLVADGMPYLGFSAGAAVAARRAIVGGYRQGDVVVCSPDCDEDLDELTVVEGLGLVDLTVEVHAAQWGPLTRLMAAVESGMVAAGVAVDEDTVLVVGDRATHVAGAGRVWWVSRDGAELRVRLEGAGL